MFSRYAPALYDSRLKIVRGIVSYSVEVIYVGCTEPTQLKQYEWALTLKDWRVSPMFVRFMESLEMRGGGAVNLLILNVTIYNL